MLKTFNSIKSSESGTLDVRTHNELASQSELSLAKWASANSFSFKKETRNIFGSWGPLWREETN